MSGMLETDFPLTAPARPASSFHSHAMWAGQRPVQPVRGASSLQRPYEAAKAATPNTVTTAAYARSTSLGLGSPAEDWQYQSAMAPGIVLSSSGRSGSMKKAYSESSSGVDEDAKAETEPLCPAPAVTRTRVVTTTVSASKRASIGTSTAVKKHSTSSSTSGSSAESANINVTGASSLQR